MVYQINLLQNFGFGENMIGLETFVKVKRLLKHAQREIDSSETKLFLDLQEWNRN